MANSVGSSQPAWTPRLGLAMLGSLVLCLLCSLVACAPNESNAPEIEPIRVALFNVKELSRAKLESHRSQIADSQGALTPEAAQIAAAVAIVVRVQPDVLVLQEIDQGSDQDPASVARQFGELLAAEGVDYPHVFAAPSNTGRLTGIDLDQDGLVATEANLGTREHGNDSYGFGTYPGQYSMAVLSRTPFDLDRVRTFQTFLWQDLPGHHIDTGLDEPFLSPEARKLFRLSSKSHWDLPVRVSTAPDAPALHLLISHPTPPVFDGPEDRNGRRNFDEIKFWADYLTGGTNAEALIDDNGLSGGFDAHSTSRHFVIAGDLNAFPDVRSTLDAAPVHARYDGRTAISQLLEHSRVQDTGPLQISSGAPHTNPSATAGFNGGARIDYLLPARELAVTEGGVYWPSSTEDPDGALLAQQASDHRLVWLDVVVDSTSTID